MSPRTSVQFEIEVPKWQQRERAELPAFVANPVAQRTAGRSVTYTGLAGFHPLRRGRFRLGLLGGVGVATQTSTVTNYGTDDVTTWTRTEQVPVLAYGADADIALSQRLSVVAQVRGYLRWGFYFGREATFRPGVAFRWRF